VPDGSHIVDKVVGSRIRPDFPDPSHTVLRHTDPHSYPGPNMPYHTADREQVPLLVQTVGSRPDNRALGRRWEAARLQYCSKCHSLCIGKEAAVVVRDGK